MGGGLLEKWNDVGESVVSKVGSRIQKKAMQKG